MKNLFIILFTAAAPGISCSQKLPPDQYWSDHRRVVTEMKQAPVQLSGTSRDAYLEFNTKEKRFTGNGGCNRLSGNHMPGKKNSIHFGEVISTKMSCADIAFETLFLAELNKVNRYEVTGNLMLLKDGNEVLLILEKKNCLLLLFPFFHILFYYCGINQVHLINGTVLELLSSKSSDENSYKKQEGFPKQGY